jgi:hypothetical protein
LKAKASLTEPLTVWTNGVVGISIGGLAVKAPFDKPENPLELIRHVNEIPGVAFADDAIEG